MEKLTPRDVMKLYGILDVLSSADLNDFIGDVSQKSGTSTKSLLENLKPLEEKGIIKFEEAIVEGKGKGRKCVFINEDIKNLSVLTEVILNSLYFLFFKENDYKNTKILPGIFYLLSSENGNSDLIEAVESLLERRRVPRKNKGLALKVLNAWLRSDGSVNTILSRINKPEIEKYEIFKKGFDVLQDAKIMSIFGERVYLDPSFISEFMKYRVKVPLQTILINDALTEETEV